MSPTARHLIMNRGDRSTVDVCRICCAPLHSQGVKSELFRGVICRECARLERIGFMWSGAGPLVTVLVWALIQLLYRAGVVSKAPQLIFLALAPLWFFVCLLLVYSRLRKRGGPCKAGGDVANRGKIVS